MFGFKSEKKKKRDWDKEFKTLWYFEWEWPLCPGLICLKSWFPVGVTVCEVLGGLVLEEVFAVVGLKGIKRHS